MKPRICGLATVFLRSAIGASAAFILVGSFTAVASAETAIERGSYLVNTIGACGNCHARDSAFNRTPDLAGGLEENLAPGHIVFPNITPDPETGIGKWTEAEIVVALRDGKRPDGSIIGPPMPIVAYRQLSDHDAEAIAAYLRSLKPVKNSLARSQYTITLPPIYGSPITHVDEPVTTDKVGYGGYLVGFGHCVLCHTPLGDDGKLNMSLAFAGGREFRRENLAVVSRNITTDPADGLGTWSDGDIKNAITKAIRPDGTKLVGPMPFEWYAEMTSVDLDAIVAYMRTIKPVKAQ
jgi:mono/diheme cytochrome c family protein